MSVWAARITLGALAAAAIFWVVTTAGWGPVIDLGIIIAAVAGVIGLTYLVVRASGDEW